VNSLAPLVTRINPSKGSGKANQLSSRYNEQGIYIKKILDGVAIHAQQKQKMLSNCSEVVGFYVALTDVKLYDGIKADGCISFLPDVTMVVDINSSKIKHIKFSTSATISSSLQIHSGVELDFLNKEVTIASFELPPIVVAPSVVITPEVDVVVGIEGKSSLNLETGVSNEVRATVGAVYNNSTWANVSDQKSDFDFIIPTISDETSLIGYAGPELNLLLYGVIGAGSNLHGNLDIQTSILGGLKWELYGGLRAGVQVRAEILDRTLMEYSKPDIIGYRTLLATSAGIDHQWINKGIVAYYPFNENANDMSSNNNHGVEYGDIDYVEGKVGLSASLNGINNHIIVNDNESLRMNYPAASCGVSKSA
jgi:hypothetical protein